jgi:hypothetical protein
MFMRMQVQTLVHIALPQGYTMADQYEPVNLGDYDVVRSTQFADEHSRGVHDSSQLFFTFIEH